MIITCLETGGSTVTSFLWWEGTTLALRMRLESIPHPSHALGGKGYIHLTRLAGEKHSYLSHLEGERPGNLTHFTHRIVGEREELDS